MFFILADSIRREKEKEIFFAWDSDSKEGWLVKIERPFKLLQELLRP